MTGREKQSARNAHTVLLRPSVVGALPAVGAEQEEEAELPWDRKVLSVKDPLGSHLARLLWGKFTSGLAYLCCCLCHMFVTGALELLVLQPSCSVCTGLVKLLGELGLAAAGLSMEFQSRRSIFYIMKQQRLFLLLKIF